MIKKRHHVPVTSVLSALSFLLIKPKKHKAENPEHWTGWLNTKIISDLWIFTGTNNTFHKWASESWESTSKDSLCTIYAQLTNDSGYDISLKTTSLTSKQRVPKSWQEFRQWLCRHSRFWQQNDRRRVDYMRLPSCQTSHVHTHWLQFLLEWPSARAVSATKISKLVWPCGHIWVTGALSKSTCSKPARAAQLSHLRLVWPCTAKPSAPSHRAKVPTQPPVSASVTLTVPSPQAGTAGLPQGRTFSIVLGS